MPRKVIIGLVGHIASGKGTAVDYLEQTYGAANYRFSTVLRDLLDRLYLDQTRENIVTMSETIRRSFGNDILTTTLLQDALNDPNPIIILDGIRRVEELPALLARPEFVLVEIVAEPKLRYERLTKRSENIDDQTKTFAQFLADEQRSTEVTIGEVAAQAKLHLDNNGTAEQLHAQLDALISTYTA